MSHNVVAFSPTRGEVRQRVCPTYRPRRRRQLSRGAAASRRSCRRSGVRGRERCPRAAAACRAAANRPPAGAGRSSSPADVRAEPARARGRRRRRAREPRAVPPRPPRITSGEGDRDARRGSRARGRASASWPAGSAVGSGWGRVSGARVRPHAGSRRSWRHRAAATVPVLCASDERVVSRRHRASHRKRTADERQSGAHGAHPARRRPRCACSSSTTRSTSPS